MPKSYSPGQRDRKYKPQAKLSEERYAWVRVEGMTFMILVGTGLEGTREEDVVLWRPTTGAGRGQTINLTNLTEEELIAMKAIFDAAFEWALPVVKRRDKEANDAWAKGDDSFDRIYRAVPQLVWRKRPKPEHFEGVHDGPEPVLDSNGTGGAGSDGGIRRIGDELVEHDSGESESQDNSTPTDQPTRVRSLGRTERPSV